MVIFQTKKIIVRKVLNADFIPLHNIYTIKENMRYVSSGKYDWTLQELKEKYNRFNSRYEKGIGLFIVVDKKTNAVIGEAGFFDSFHDLSIPEIGYILDRNIWGKGYGSELCEGMIQYCFTQLKAEQVIARMYAENIASIRVCEKNGMRKVEAGIKEGRQFYEYRI